MRHRWDRSELESTRVAAEPGEEGKEKYFKHGGTGGPASPGSGVGQGNRVQAQRTPCAILIGHKMAVEGFMAAQCKFEEWSVFPREDQATPFPRGPGLQELCVG